MFVYTVFEIVVIRAIIIVYELKSSPKLYFVDQFIERKKEFLYSSKTLKL